MAMTVVEIANVLATLPGDAELRLEGSLAVVREDGSTIVLARDDALRVRALGNGRFELLEEEAPPARARRGRAGGEPEG